MKSPRWISEFEIKARLKLLRMILVATPALAAGLSWGVPAIAMADAGSCIASSSGLICIGDRVGYVANSATGVLVGINVYHQTVDVDWDANAG